MIRRLQLLAICASLISLASCASKQQIGCGECTNPGIAYFLYATGTNDLSTFSFLKGAEGAPSASLGQSGPNQPTGIAADASGKFLYVSDFTNDAVEAFTINGSNGVLTSVNGSPFSLGTSPDAGGLAIDPAAKFLYVTLINSGEVAGFSIDSSTGSLTPIASSPFAAGNTPMQAIVDPSGKFLYVCNYNDPMGTISGYAIDPTTGALAAIAGSPFPTQAGYPGPSGLAFGAGGKFLYVSMAGTVNPNNVISAFAVDSTTGALSQISGSPFAAGKDPMRIVSDGAGKFLFSANSQDSTVSAFTINSASGLLTPVQGSPFAVQGEPEPLAIDPAGAFLYVGATGVSAFSVNVTTGALSPVPGTPFSTTSTFNGGLAIVK